MDAVISSEETWDDALTRLLVFLDRFEIGGQEHRVRVALRIVDEARRAPGEGSPVERVMRRAFAELDQWFGQALEAGRLPVWQALPVGATALQIVPGRERWSERILSEPPSDELKKLLAVVELRAGPELAHSSMTSREMDYGAMETLAHETWHKFAWTPILRAAALWTAIFFLALYLYDRYFPQ